MRTIALFTTLALLLATPAYAQLTEIMSLDGRADCNDWSADAEVHFRDGAMMMRLEYAVVLADADGAVVDRVDFSDWIEFEAGATITMSWDGVWAQEADDGWQVLGHFDLIEVGPDLMNHSIAQFTTTLACAEFVDPDAPLCVYPAGWYRAHPDAWPARTLDLAGETLTEEHIAQLLRRQPRGILPVMVAKQVIAAKFNLLKNPQADMPGAIAEADAWLTVNSPFVRGGRNRGSSSMWRDEIPTVRALLQPLQTFNGAGCADLPLAVAEADLGDMPETLDKAFDSMFETEAVSFGSLKAQYR